MTTRSGSATYKGLGRDGVGHVSTQSGVLHDQKYGFGTRFGDEPGTNPEELLAAAHASCFTMALSFALAQQGFADGELATTAKVTLVQADGGFTITKSELTLTATVPGVEPAQFEEIAQGAKANCPLSKVLNAELSLTYTLEQG